MPSSVREPAGIELREGEVHVWRVDLTVETDPFALVLTPEEQQRASRFHFAKGRAHFVITRGALRMLLGRYLQRNPADIPIEFSQHGKPFVPSARVRFNLAHSHETALIALALDHEVGVDLEYAARRTKVADLARAILSPAELERWKELSDQDQRTSFFKHWVAKEAYLKALGIGLGKDPKLVEIASLPIQHLEVGADYWAALMFLSDTVPLIRQHSFKMQILDCLDPNYGQTSQ